MEKSALGLMVGPQATPGLSLCNKGCLQPPEECALEGTDLIQSQLGFLSVPLLPGKLSQGWTEQSGLERPQVTWPTSPQ